MSIINFHKVSVLPPTEELEANAFYYVPDGPSRTKGYLTSKTGEPREIGKTSELVGDGVNGAIFISDIKPQDDVEDNVYSKVWKDDYEDGKKQLISCQTTTNLVKITLTAVVGNTNYKPYIYKGLPGTPDTGDPIPYQTSLDPRDLNAPEFVGTIDINLENDDAVEAIEGGYYIRYHHEDGAACEVLVTTVEAPEITSAEFDGENSYPILEWSAQRQLHLANGNTTQLRITTDVPVTKVHFLSSHPDFENDVTDNVAFDDGTEAVPSSPSNDFIISNNVKNHNYEDIRNGYAIIRVEDEHGTLSEPFFTGTVGTGVDKKEFVKLDNKSAVISILDIEYPTFDLNNNPVNQLALKAAEEATVSYTASHTGSHETIFEHNTYGNIEFVGDPPTTTENATVKWDGTGDGFNLTDNNISFIVKRGENGKISTVNECVKVADTDPIIGPINIDSSTQTYFSENILRSGPEPGAGFWCTFTIDQPIFATSGGSPHGDAWDVTTGSSITGININIGTIVVTNDGLNGATVNVGGSADPSIFVLDTVEKDIFADTFNITVYNYAGREVTRAAVENQVKSRGFIPRWLENININDPKDINTNVHEILKVSGQIGETQGDAFDISVVRDPVPQEPGFDGDAGTGDFDSGETQFSVYLDTEWYFIADNNTLSAAQASGWAVNAQLEIEEII